MKSEPRFTLVHEPYNVVIRDGDLNLFFLAESGFGPKSSNIALAERVVEYLNRYEPQTSTLGPRTGTTPAGDAP